MTPSWPHAGVVVATLCALVGLTACSPAASSSATLFRPGAIAVVGSLSQYADIAAQIGGRYVDAHAIMSNPNSDPHSFEANPGVAKQVDEADLIVQNGLGYDDFMNKLESSTPRQARVVITAQNVLGLSDATANPHLWYNLAYMEKVAGAVETSLSSIDPAHAAYFSVNLVMFDKAVGHVRGEAATLALRVAGEPVAVSEPIANYLIDSVSARIATPWSLQAAVMNDTDPSPQDIAAQEDLIRNSRVAVYVYNKQVASPLSQRMLALASASHVPTVAAYEIMPQGSTYEAWMSNELADLAEGLER